MVSGWWVKSDRGPIGIQVEFAVNFRFRLHVHCSKQIETRLAQWMNAEVLLAELRDAPPMTFVCRKVQM